MGRLEAGQKPRIYRQFLRWAVTGSNRRLPACKAGALPAELTARAEDGSGVVRAHRALLPGASGTFVCVELIVQVVRELLAALLELAGRLAPASLIEWAAKTVRSQPTERVERIMRSPLRRVVLEGIFWQMPLHLDRRKATAVNAAIRWRITGRRDGGDDVYDLVLADGRARVKRGGRDEAPRLTITIDGAEFLRVAVGSSNPVNAYLGGKLALRGDVMQAARLTMLFRIPTGANQPSPSA
jgi:putative sterol carrier protein